MANKRLYQLNHCTYLCQYHLVWTPRFRGKVLTDAYIKAELKRAAIGDSSKAAIGDGSLLSTLFAFFI
jgi:REP element-mobilizing transposase RayT